MRFSVINIGCKVNRVEVDDAAARLISQGAVMAQPSEADVVLMNTCTVTAEADKKTRKAVRQVLKSNAEAQVLVTGCAAVMNPDWFESLDPRIHVVAKPEVAEKAWLYGGCTKASKEEGVLSRHKGAGLRMGSGFRMRVGIKAQDGCNNACTFCIVHVARGESRSVPFEQVIADAKRHADAGVRELVLTGINLGAYRDAGRGLAELVETLLDVCPAARIRIGSVEPKDIDDALIHVMAEADGSVCRHLHLPLQSGSSKVLSEMHRPYDAAFFVDLVSRLRAAMPQLALSTDIIVGFPGETNEDFQQTLAVARQCMFSKIHVFRYSKRAGTPAAIRPDQVPAEVSAERSRQLQELGRDLCLQDAKRRLGTAERVLVERPGQGTTESYHPVRWAVDGPQPGELVRMTLTGLSEDGIFYL